MTWTTVQGPPTRHCESRAARRIEALVLHDPGVDQPRADVLARAMAAAAPPGASYHRILGLDAAGELVEVIAVPDKDVAWHSGARTRPEFTAGTGWSGYEVNERTLGLCATMAVDEATFREWVRWRVDRFEWPVDVYAHREVAGSRTDPRQIPDMDAFRASL